MTANMYDHTQGEWTACKTLFDGKTISFRIACDEHGSCFPLAECRGNQGKYSTCEMEANAALIAAAPDLLKERDALKAANSALSTELRKQVEWLCHIKSSIDITPSSVELGFEQAVKSIVETLKQHEAKQ